MKQCKDCKQYKEESEFPKGHYRKRTNDYALNPRCRDCNREHTRKYKEKYYSKNKEAAIERAQKWKEDNPERYKQRRAEYYKNNYEDIRRKKKEYYQSPKGRRQMALDSQRYRTTPENQAKRRARWAVSNALYRGTLTKPTSCTVCKLALPLEAHHEDYGKPLEVIWLCKQCHENKHHLNEGHES